MGRRISTLTLHLCKGVKHLLETTTFSNLTLIERRYDLPEAMKEDPVASGNEGAW